jgi:Sec-independent protein translocase protein TatA
VSLAIFNIGPIELLIMAAAAVMLFGGDLPATARKAARTIGRLRTLASELGREFSAEDHLQLPKRSDFDVDLKRLTNLDDIRDDTGPSLPGRREDEPIEDSTEAPQDDDLPAWRKSVGSELPPVPPAPEDEGEDAGPLNRPDLTDRSSDQTREGSESDREER